jgi:hypothetical protein
MAWSGLQRIVQGEARRLVGVAALSWCCGGSHSRYATRRAAPLRGNGGRAVLDRASQISGDRPCAACAGSSRAPRRRQRDGHRGA